MCVYMYGGSISRVFVVLSEWGRLQEEGVALRECEGIKEVQQGRLVLEDGTEQTFDECLWCTQASAPPWLTQTGLQTGESPPPTPCLLQPPPISTTA